MVMSTGKVEVKLKNPIINGDVYSPGISKAEKNLVINGDVYRQGRNKAEKPDNQW